MANVPKALLRNTLTTTARTATVPAGKRWAITNIILVNASSAAQTVTCTVDGVPLVPGVQLAPGAMFTLDCAQVLDAGKALTATASAASGVAAHICGVEQDL